MKNPTRIKLRLWALLGVVLLLLSSRVAAQNTVTHPSSANSGPFSPSITSYNYSNQEYTLSAYTYIVGSGHRAIGISRGTPSGGSWAWSTVTTLAYPKWSSSGVAMTDMDDAQILWIGGEKIVCVVRAWDNSSLGVLGEAYPTSDDRGTIFTQSGIYVAISTDRGETWGYYSGSSLSSATTKDTWKTVVENDNLSNTDYVSTVEYPRIAYRSTFDDKGYIVWHKKTWEVNHADTTMSSSLTLGDFGLRVNDCRLGIAAFNVSLGADNTSGTLDDGWVFDYPGADPYLPANINTANHHARGPEMPSVAIAPGGGIWLAYQQVAYNGLEGDDPFPFDVEERWYGTEEPDAYLYVATGGCSVLYGVATFTFGTPEEIVHDELPGFYNHLRGYLYAKANIDPAASSAIHAMFDAPLAQGPSIQVAIANPSACTFQVGLVQSFGDGNGTDANPRSWLSFMEADVPLGGTAAEFNIGWSGDFGKSPAIPFGEQIEGDHSGSSASTGNYNMRFFPVLKYTTASADPLLASLPTSSSRKGSFFVLSYMSAFQDAANQGTQYLDSAECHTAVSFDNHHFYLTTNGGSSRVSLMKHAENNLPSTTVSPLYWGTKIDVCGEAGNMVVHPIWHSITSPTSSEDLLSNDGNCILIKPYFSQLLPSDPASQPEGQFLNYNSSGTSTYPYGPLGLFNFGANGVTSVQAVATYGGSNIFSSFQPSLSNPVANGIYYAVYNGSTGNPDIGNLGFSSQRKIVMTGNVAHAIADRGTNGGVWYSRAAQSSLASSGLIGWTPPINLCSSGLPASTHNLANECIATYQRGDVLTGGSGHTAVAVCWMTGDNATWRLNSRLAFRYKESDNCESDHWSPLYIITILDIAKDARPSITPIVAPPMSGAESYLLGWTVSWSTVATDGGDPAGTGRAGLIESINIIRSDASGAPLVRNEGWGVYPMNTSLVTSGEQNLYLGSQIPIHTFLPNFLSLVTNETNGPRTNDLSEEIAITSDGSIRGIWVMNAKYYLSGSSEGNLIAATVPFSLTIPPPVVSSGSTSYTTYEGQWDRNPSITINSSGQKFVAWEHMDWTAEGWPLDPSLYPPIGGASSQIRTAWTDFKTGKWINTYGLKNPQDWLSEKATDVTFNWLLNPSITAYPKTRLRNTTVVYPGSNFDQDPGAVELLCWQHQTATWNYSTFGWDITTPDVLHERFYYEQPAVQGVGTFGLVDPTGYPVSGSYAQRSFGPRSNGPAMSVGASYVDNNAHAYGVGNSISGGSSTLKFTTPSVGSYSLKGTYGSPLGVELYRCEEHQMNHSNERFVWGSVYVEDTTLTLASRQIVLSDGTVDTNGFASHAAMRDSLFRTEWFDWPVSARITYSRSMLNLGCASCDSAYNDSGFYDTSLRIRYTVELVHTSGRIDTIEQPTYSPLNGKFITPSEVHIVNANGTPDTVLLRVRGDFVNLPDDDSLCLFAKETRLGSYLTSVDTTIAISSSSGPVAPSTSTCLSALGPYPNPVHTGSTNTSILYHYCSSGASLTVKVFDVLGSQVGATVNTTSNGQTWQRIGVPTPVSSGAYHVKISDGTDLVSLSMTVTY